LNKNAKPFSVHASARFALVTQTSKSAVSQVSKPAIFQKCGACRLGSRRYSRFGNLRYERGRGTLLSAFFLLFFTFSSPAEQIAFKAQPRWWKGNLHTHTLWSDGDDYPEMVTEWYKTNGYHFLGLSDHNIVLQGEKWIHLNADQRRERAFEKYLERFGSRWVETKTLQSTQMVRLRPLEEFRRLFEQPGRFLLIPSEEISDQYKKAPIHLNATNLRDFIKPRGGTNILDVLQRNVDAVLEQREKSRRPMFPHINHPNFGWAITAEDLMRVRGDRFFEVYNGHPDVRNRGDDWHASTERVWDILLTFRLAELRLPPMFALAVDDSHKYHFLSPTNSNPGRGWVMVRAASLTPPALIAAMEAGDFYATSGVRLKDVRRERHRLALEIEAEEGVTYTTQFIGTFRGFESRIEPTELPAKVSPPVTRRYSQEIGKVLGEVTGASATYYLKGNELYIRAKITSSRPKANPCLPEEVECAWTQPLVP